MSYMHARVSDPGTSHEAMAAYNKERMENAVNWVIHLYKTYGPMADYQLEVAFSATWPEGCSRHLYQQARSVARDRGRIVATPRRVINPASKRKQIVWEYCPEGCEVIINKCPTCGKVVGRTVNNPGGGEQ